MACKPDEIFEAIDNQQAFDNAVALLKEETLLAVKCISIDGTEGNRETDTVYIMVATKEKAYIFDIPKIGKTVFISCLKSILESKSQEKLMFDCREQSDALWHQFQVKLSGVLDLQLLEVMYRRQKSSSKKPVAKHTRRSHRPEEVEFVYGFYHCMELYVGDVLFEGKEEKERTTFMRLCRSLQGIRSKSIYTPDLRDKLVKQIFLTKVTSLFALYEKMKEILGDEEKNRLLIASERYADFYRNRQERSFDSYEVGRYGDINISKMPEIVVMPDFRRIDGIMDAYLPLDIIPEKGTHSSVKANHTCTTCARKYPIQEFSSTQLQNGNEKCRVCKEIKRREDVESNRKENYERNWSRWRSPRYRDYLDDDVVSDCGNDYCCEYGCRCTEDDD